MKRLQGPPSVQKDKTPLAMPVGTQRPTPLHEIIARYVREAVEQERGEQFETMEEADDFEEEETDLLDLSPYEFGNIQDDYVPEPPQEQDPLPEAEPQIEAEPDGEPPEPQG